MKIALIGYGKMGRAIEEIALARGHEIVLRIRRSNLQELTATNLRQANVAIEFSGPESAASHVRLCLEEGVPVISGSTGWNEDLEAVKKFCEEQKGAFIHASNFSIGVNLFFEINKFLATLMASHPDYEVQLKEIHHTQKKDAPSGTAITLASQVMQHIPRKKKWVNEFSEDPSELEIISERTDPAPGTHYVTYSSTIDEIQISHTAHSRTGFALGAVMAAEFLFGRVGIYSMQDVLGLGKRG